MAAKPSLDSPAYEGWLHKQGGNVKNWKKRWFILKDTSLYYFGDRKNIRIGKELGVIDILGALVYSPQTDDDYFFNVETSGRTYYLQASSRMDAISQRVMPPHPEDNAKLLALSIPKNFSITQSVPAINNNNSINNDGGNSAVVYVSSDPPPSNNNNHSESSRLLDNSSSTVTPGGDPTPVLSPTTSQSNTSSSNLYSPPPSSVSSPPPSSSTVSSPTQSQGATNNTNNTPTPNPETTKHAPPLTASVSHSVIPTFNSMKQQDVQVRVHIIEARELKGRNSNGQSDPVCFVKVLGETKNTSIQKKTTSCTWDHLFIFQLKLFPDEMNAGVIDFSVFNANAILRNELIGSHQVDFTRVYNSPGHELYRVWMALVDTTNQHSGVQGYLKASITVLRASDPIPAHDPNDDDDESKDSGDDLQKMILLPPTIKTEEYFFNIRVFRGDNIPRTNLLSKPDSFVHVAFAGAKMKTSISKGTHTPTWNEELKLPVTMPTLSDTITFQLYDSRTVGFDALISTRYLKFSDVLAKANYSTGPFWVNFYGSPYVVAPSQTDDNMNKGLIEPTAFKGRVLIDMSVVKATNPKVMKVPSSAAPEDPREQQYSLRMDLYEALELRIPVARALEKIVVEVVWGHNKLTSNAVPSHKAHTASLTSDKKQAYWFESLPEIQCRYNPESVPDVFISVYTVSLVGERNRLGLLHFRMDELSINSPPRWMALNPDVSLENEFLKLFNPKNSFGFLLFKLSYGPTNDITKITRLPVKKPTMAKYIVRSYIYQGRYLPAADGTGLSDPYCIIKVGPAHADTKVKMETLAPHWYEVVDIPVEMPTDLTLAPDINVYVWDYNAIQQHSKLGRFHVPMYGLSTKPSPITWYAIGDIEGTEGEVLASFQLIPYEQAASYPITNIAPQEKDCIVEIDVIGLRNLLPYGLLPIEHAYLEFDVGQHNPQGKKHSVKTSVCNYPTGENPNHLEVLTLPTKIPLDPVFAPSLTVRVYDQRLGRDPLIATTYISIADFIPWIERPKVEKKQLTTSKIGTIIKAKTQFKKLLSGEEEGSSSSSHNPTPPADISSSAPSNETTALISKNVSYEMGQYGTDEHKEEATAGDHVAVDMPFNDVQESDIVNDEGATEEHLPDEEEEKHEERLNLPAGPLENEFKPAFQETTLIRGKKKGLNFFERLQAKLQGPLQFPAGKYKGTCKVYEKGTGGPLPDLKSIYRATPYVVRVYILHGSGLIPKDANGLSDPYLIVSVGKGEGQTINARDSHIKETLNPQFYKFFELPVLLPGNSELEIQCWDYNMIAGDEHIGTTVIDLENRLFSDEWKQYPLKPLEWRSLWHPSSSNPQGHISLWEDILTPEEAATTPPTPIGPPVIKPYEMRLVIWETKDVVFKDKESSDVFFTGIVMDQPKQETDVHWRCDDGNAKFNYRMVWPVELPCKHPRLKLQIWDKDILSPNDVIAEAVINLKSFFTKTYKAEKSSAAIPKQYISMYHPNHEGIQGKVEVQIDLLSEEEARSNPVGKGREEPNNHPFLPPPDRPDTSFSPFRPDQKYKPKIIICLVITAVVICLPVIMFILKTFFGISL